MLAEQVGLALIGILTKAVAQWGCRQEYDSICKAYSGTPFRRSYPFAYKDGHN